MIILTGNGFNYMIMNFIKNSISNYTNELNLTQEELNDLNDKIQEITALWKEFDKFFKDLMKEYPTLNSEEIIKMINLVLNFLSNSDTLEKLIPDCKEHIAPIKLGMEKAIGEKILEICNKFRTFEQSDNYKLIKKLFPNFGDKIRSSLTEKNIQPLFLTTNYDGIEDTILTNHGTFIPDGFGKNKHGDLVLIEDNLNKDELFFHIHGSYKFKKDFYETIKLRQTSENLNPLMIFNQPELKKKQIMEDNVLREYFYIFEEKLKTCKNFIIIGNSLKNEPHIIELLKKQEFNDEHHNLYIYDNNPEQVEKTINNEFKRKIINFNIKKINTEIFNNSEKFIDNLLSIN